MFSIMVSNDTGGVDVSSCMGIEGADGVGGVISVLCSGVVGGRVKFESGWFRVAGVVRVARVVGVVGIGGEMAGFAAESLAGVVGVVRVVGVAGIGVLFSENGVPVNGWS